MEHACGFEGCEANGAKTCSRFVHSHVSCPLSRLPLTCCVLRRCRTVWYCGTAHQKKCWQTHKLTCKVWAAAVQGDSKAQFHLGGFYQQGVGVEQDMKEAARWYRAAANQGDSVALSFSSLSLSLSLCFPLPFLFFLTLLNALLNLCFLSLFRSFFLS